MEVPAALASCLGISQGITVAVKVLPDIPQAIGICVEPVSTDDWEVVEQNAGYMEEQILNQARLYRPDAFGSHAKPVETGF